MAELHSSYPLTVRWTHDREGLAIAPGGLPTIAVGPPPQFQGPGGCWSPEHLFVAAAASCWMTTFAGIAAKSKLEFVSLEAASEGFVEQGEDRRFRVTRMVLRPRIGIRRDEDRDKALRIAEKAHEVCLISRSITSRVELEPEIAVLAPA
jgi:peroxiredoxin-like protein